MLFLCSSTARSMFGFQKLFFQAASVAVLMFWIFPCRENCQISLNKDSTADFPIINATVAHQTQIKDICNLSENVNHAVCLCHFIGRAAHTHTVFIHTICVLYTLNICYSQMSSSHCKYMKRISNRCSIRCDCIQPMTALTELSLKMMERVLHSSFCWRTTTQGCNCFPVD